MFFQNTVQIQEHFLSGRKWVIYFFRILNERKKGTWFLPICWFTTILYCKIYWPWFWNCKYMSFNIVHLGSDWLSWLYIGQVRKCKSVIFCSNIIICALSKFSCSHMNNYKWIKDLEEKEYVTTVSLLKGRASWSIIATLLVEEPN